MAKTICEDDYLPWLIAFDFNFAPYETLKSDVTDIGDDEMMVTVASQHDSVGILVVYDQAWSE